MTVSGLGSIDPSNAQPAGNETPTTETEEPTAAAVRGSSPRNPLAVLAGSDDDPELALAEALRNDPNNVVSERDARRIVSAALADIEKASNPRTAFESHHRTMEAAVIMRGADPDVADVLATYARRGEALVTRVLASELPPTTFTPTIPDVHISGDGLTLAREGDMVRIHESLVAQPTRHDQTTATLTVDGHEVVVLGPGARTVSSALFDLSQTVPEGYGASYLGASSDADTPNARTYLLRITKDPLGTLSSQQALEKAREGIIEHLKNGRMAERDWRTSLPDGGDWDAAVANGLLDGVTTFGTDPDDAEIGRGPASYLFSGRGPYDLYTEVEVNKADGSIKSVYIEID